MLLSRGSLGARDHFHSLCPSLVDGPALCAARAFFRTRHRGFPSEAVHVWLHPKASSKTSTATLSPNLETRAACFCRALHVIRSLLNLSGLLTCFDDRRLCVWLCPCQYHTVYAQRQLRVTRRPQFDLRKLRLSLYGIHGQQHCETGRLNV
ncbi:hypothetical protein BC628DRAFT_1015793 [Trametes gibbosa]|nr:hypothetical protein BC628DRAFT_1015793 [Trametes gibbosa]